jgi:fibronectin type 3 domain-containing protein
MKFKFILCLCIIISLLISFSNGKSEITVDSGDIMDIFKIDDIAFNNLNEAKNKIPKEVIDNIDNLKNNNKQNIYIEVVDAAGNLWRIT